MVLDSIIMQHYPQGCIMEGVQDAAWREVKFFIFSIFNPLCMKGL